MAARMNSGGSIFNIVSGAPVSTMLTAAMLSGALTTASPASAEAGICFRQCYWRAVMGTCKTVFTAHVPCPLKEKVCGERICSQSIE